MASQIYSRWVPPTKKSKVAPAPANVNGITPAKFEKKEAPPPPPATKPDASATYARYVPPTKPKKRSKPVENGEPMDIDGAPEPTETKKSKYSQRTEISSTSLPSPASTHAETSIEIGASNFEESEEPRRKKEKPKKRKREEEQPEATAEEKSRHEDIFQRRAKSAKRLEKIAKAEAAQAALAEDADNEVEEEQPLEVHPLEPLPQPEPRPEQTGTISALPPWLRNPIRVAGTATADFKDLGIEEHAATTLKSKGFQNAFAVQAAVLPLLLPGPRRQTGDVLVSAATGSGKTLSYVLPMIKDISQTTVTRLRGVIVMPTRELVTQARDVCEICASAFSHGGSRRVKIGVAVGNQTMKVEQASLMEDEQCYDPEAYRKRERELNAKWESSSCEDDDGDLTMLDEDDLLGSIPDYVIKPKPRVDVLICTPGRLVEHLKSTKGFPLDFVKWLVIDEADKLLDQSFQQWLEVVMGKLPGNEKHLTSWRDDAVRKIVLSATMTRDVGQLSGLKLYRPKLVVLEGESRPDLGPVETEEHVLPDTLRETAVKVDADDEKPLYLLDILEQILPSPPISNGKAAAEDDDDTSSDDSSSSDEDSSSSDDDSTSSDDDSSDTSSSDSSSSDSSDATESKPAVKAANTKKEPIDHQTPHGVLVFTKSNETALRLSRLLALLSPAHAPLIGTLTSTHRASARKRTLLSFQSRKLSILIASDLVSRGLDLPNLAHVVNYDMPTSLTSYVHRVGRTARAGKEGHAWTLFGKTEGRWFWTDVARSEKVRRPWRVERVNRVEFGEGRREEYKRALEELGREAQ